MIPQEIRTAYSVLTAFLGESKRELTENFQCQFPCPRCIENKGNSEKRKYNLEVNIKKGVFSCWSCAQHDDEMHGSIRKLFHLYGTPELWKEYAEALDSFRKSRLYQLHYSNDDFKTDTQSKIKEELFLPSLYHKFNENGHNNFKALKYLKDRGIGWDIINEFNLGYTDFNKEHLKMSTRIIIPSNDAYKELNYWTGRDYSGKSKQKYYNPQTERKDLIFNEDKIQWDAPITLVEGPFDHLVVPNSIPLLGKVLKSDFEIYKKLIQYANAGVNIFLDGDALEDVRKIYSVLNHGRLYGKIHYIPVAEDLDPSKIYELYGKDGIIKSLKNAQKIKEVYL